MIINIDNRKDKPENSGMVYSSFQVDIFNTIGERRDNILIEAVAGSGKTTTILHALELIPESEDSIFVAFNKSIADELCTKVPPHIEARTLHSVGFQILRQNYKRVNTKTQKTMDILKNQLLDFKGNREHRDAVFNSGKDIANLISRAKSGMLEELTQEYVDVIVDHADLDIPLSPFWYTIYRRLLELSYIFDGEENKAIDFDDMLVQPLLRDCVFPQFDNVFVDEAQDLNHVQRLFISRLLKPTGRLIAVGDTHQAIYGFRGASHNSMELIRTHYDCIELPLSICYRCDKDIVAHAQEYVEHIEARDSAERGIVTEIEYGYHWDEYKNGDHILCRTNAPLFREAMRLLINGSPVCILGKDMGRGLMRICKDIDKKWGGIDKHGINQHYEDEAWRIPEKQKYKKMALRDRCDVLCYIVEDENLSVEKMKEVLDTLLYDKPPAISCITLSTIHKAKGLEADRVFILRPDLLPWPYASTQEEIQQEENLHYVAITRAKHALIYLRDSYYE